MSTNSVVRRVQMRFGKEELVLETGRLAKQASGSVMVQYGGTVVLVATVVSKEPKAGLDFFPLTVEYQEKTYAAGKIPGGFFKREGRPSEKEILTSRLVDRPIRPLFPKDFRNEVQIMALVLSHDGVNDPDILALQGASTALGLAGCPIMHQVGACRVGRVAGQFVLNPTFAELEQSDLDIVVAATKEGVIMVESGAKEVPEEVIIEAMRFAEEQALASIRLQEELIASAGVTKIKYSPAGPAQDLLDKVRNLAEGKAEANLRARSSKESLGEERKALIKELHAQLQNPEGTLTEGQVDEAVSQVEKKVLRKMILDEGRRIDGRDLTTVRPIACDIGVLPRTHGSGLFTRGQTQSLTAATLGTGDDEQMIDALTGKWYKAFMLHYNFPSFSVGEVRPVRGPGRREIGHGALAEKSLRAVLPPKEKFPYTVRLVSEILESNGSSSMATVCAATLALMDAGVPIKAPVSGVAMGLIKEGDRYKVLTDIIGLEDHYGDMDFKVAGTSQGITGLQLDLKLAGVPLAVLSDAISQAKPARALILEKMTSTIAAPKPDLSPFAPRITILKINPEKIGELIGPGGKTIRKITGETGVSIDVEDDGTVKVASSDAAAAQKAVDFIRGLTEEAEIGRVYQGVVRRITNFGAFCEIAPGKEGLCHVSELSDQFVPKVEDVVKLGDTLPMKVVEIDSMGRINLSHKQALLPPGTEPVPPRRSSSSDRGDRGGRGGEGDSGGHGGPPREHRGGDRGGRGGSGGGGFRRDSRGGPGGGGDRHRSGSGGGSPRYRDRESSGNRERVERPRSEI